MKSRFIGKEKNKIYLRRLAAILCLLVILSVFLISCTRGDQNSGTPTLIYELDVSGSFFFVRGLGELSENELVIPSRHDRKDVKSVAAYAFWNRTDIWYVHISSGIESIENDAFSECYHIESISLPNTLKRISEYAFNNCASLLEIRFSGTCDEWRAIEKEKDWNRGTPNYTVYCTDGNIIKKAER